MNLLKKYLPSGIEDEAVVCIEYKEKSGVPPKLERIIKPLNRDIKPNVLLAGEFKTKAPLRDDINTVGKSEVTFKIPCFREEIDEVFELGIRSAVRRVVENTEKIQGSVTREELQKFKGDFIG